MNGESRNSVQWVHGMNENGFSHTTDIRVRYAETDGMKVVYHGNYLTYFEEARTQLFRNIGIVYADIEKSGIFLVVLEAHVRYRRSAVYDDVLHVTASVDELPSMKLSINYSVTRNEERESLVTGTTVHAFIDAESGKPIRPPAKYMNAIEKYFYHAQ